jgi:copper(I)-binding protein
MFTKFRFNFIYTIILITFTSTSFGETLNFKNLVIKDFWIKPSIGNHKITSGYLIIQNNSNFDERLI